MPMNKIISLNPSDRNTEGSVIRPSQTILNRYKEKTAKHGGELPLDDLYKFLSGENARIMARRRSDDSLDAQTLEECREFASFYISKISRETRRAVSSRLGGLPFFIRKGVEVLSAQSLPPDCSSSMTSEQLHVASSVVRHVEEMSTNRLVTFCIVNPKGDNLYKTLAFDVNASAEEMQARKQKLLAYTGYLVYYGGRLILRQYLPDQKYILSGFSASNGKLQAIPAEKLKEDFQNSPKCTEADIGSMTFITPVLP